MICRRYSRDTVKNIAKNIAEKDERIANLEKAVKRNDIGIDNLEQYGRRQNIWIEGLAYTEGETNADIENLVIEELAKIDISIKKRDIVRLHRTSKPTRNNHGEGRVAQTIVKFGRWKAREKCHGVNKTARQKKVTFRIHHDLTKRRYVLLKGVRERIDQKMRAIYGSREIQRDENVFAYADINSNLRVRAGQSTFPFNSKSEFNDVFDDIFREQNAQYSQFGNDMFSDGKTR